MRGLALLLIWLAMVPLALRQPYIGVLLWDWTAFITPNYYVYGFAAGLQFNKIVAGITMISLLFSEERKKIHWDANLILLLVLLLQGTISYLLASHNYAAPPVFDKFWKECALCVLINLLITNRVRLHSILVISAIALGFHVADAGLKMIVSGGQHHMQGIGGFGDNNQSAIPLLMILPILYYLSRHSVHWLVKSACLAGVFLDVPAVMATWSRGAFVGLGVLAIGLVVLSKRRLRALALVGIGAVAVLSLASVRFTDRIDTIRTADDDTSFMGRVLAWEVSYEIAREHPFFGAGFHGVQDVSIWGEYVHKVEIPEALRGDRLPAAKAAHSIYFEVMGDLGFLGLFLFMLQLLLGFYNIRRVIKFTKRNPDLQWMYDLAVMLRLSLIAYATSGAAVSMAWFEFFWVVLMLVSVLARFCREIEAETAVEAKRTRLSAGPLRLGPIGRPAVARAVGGEPL